MAHYCAIFGRITVTLGAFSPLWGLGAMHTVHLRLIEKLVVNFLFVLIERFSLYM